MYVVAMRWSIANCDEMRCDAWNCERRDKIKEAATKNLEDRICNLPDDVLTHVLSFVTTKDSVKTSILSSAWKSLWASVPSLDLDELDFCHNALNSSEAMEGNSRFTSFIDNFLMRRRVSSMRKICISGGSKCRSKWMNTLICAAIDRNVLELELNFDSEDGESIEPPLELPQSLYFSKTLVVLKLSLDMVLNFPMPCVCFPNLKVLFLDNILYKDDDSIQNLLSSCPVLEDLVLLRNQTDNLRTFNVTSQTLKKLLVRFRLAHVCEPKKIVIDAPALESLDIDDNVTIDCELKNLLLCNKSEIMPLIRLLQKLYLHFLWHCLCACKCVSPTFGNLTCLNLIASQQYSWVIIVDILCKSPKLEVLILEGLLFCGVGGLAYEDDIPYRFLDLEVPSCLLSHLKRLYIKGFSGFWCENIVIQYFLDFAEVLEKFTVETFGVLKKSLEKAMVEFPRASLACEIQVCDFL
ncbi:hypothetical protein RJ639_014065 [Escallonia herrerae]|uniref:F-box domain-containing protein n=1 Tax=Escallonia herrerae TaxID=1293975 RepID=A0AA89ANL1_9ASTE|nr:hypothetical protein RJ639_014065 [Escallonia herrerae]